MDWNENKRPFAPSAESSLSFLYNYTYNPYPVKTTSIGDTTKVASKMDKMEYGNREKKKKRLTSNQIESLERSFQEEIKLEPHRKMKLSKELGLEPRQIAVWFQNRRTRWKAKQLEHLYGALKQEFHVISKEKQKLQDEVMKLKARLREQAFMAQISCGNNIEISGEETVESKSEALSGSNKLWGTSNSQQIAENYCSFTVEDYNAMSLPHWTAVPYYPSSAISEFNP